MKLWKKISLICSVILIVIVTLCSAILLSQTQEKILSLTYEQANNKLATLTRSFEEMVNYYYSEEDSAVVNHSLIYYCFSNFADSSAVLQLDGKTIYSNSEIRPDAYLPLEQYDNRKQFAGEIGGRQFLIVGRTVSMLSSADSLCAVYVVEDITPVYEGFTKLFWQFVLIGSCCIIIGMLLIMTLVRRAMRPLTQLQGTASRIAAGDYHQRADVRSRDEVGLLAADFNQMAEAVENHIHELTERAERQQLFIGGVTHEFKTPLTSLLLNADTLQNTYMEEEERMAALANIERQCKWLERLVQKLLKLITLEQELELKIVSVPDLLDSVQESVAESLHSRGIALEVHCSTDSLRLDADMMQSVLVNLVDNASKASVNGQTVTLSAYDNVLEVKDNGIGIPKEALDRITEPFYMVDKSRSKKNGGVGLGLALVKEIVKAHGAMLEIESVPGQGTTVRIRLQP